MAFKKRNKKFGPQNLNLLPFMNLFSILIPFLLSVAVFQRLGVLEISMPERSANNTSGPVDVDEQNLNLALLITDHYLTIGANGGFMPNYYYAKFAQYKDPASGESFVIPYVRGQEVKSPKSGRVMTKKELEKFLYTFLDKKDSADPGQERMVIHNHVHEPLLDTSGQWYTRSLNVGDVYRIVGYPEVRVATQQEINDFNLAPLSVFSEVGRVLWSIKLQAQLRENVPADLEKIILLANPRIAYDAIIQGMDASKYSGFNQIALSLLGG